MSSAVQAGGNGRRHVKSLDGLRGFCALWVLIGHTLSLTGLHSSAWGPLAHPLLGVDAFIALSGFLMLMHYRERQSKEPWQAASTWGRFWVRRLFRVAPLYYAAILLVLIFRTQILAAWDVSRPDLDYITLTPHFFLQHLSFIFGILPGSYWSRPLPDWSLSLEMQFYVVFPFIALLWARFGPWRTTAMLVVLCLVITRLAASYFAAFELPSPLPAKLAIFLSGMLIASWAPAEGPRLRWLALLAVMLSFLPLPGAGGAPSMISRAAIMGLIACLVGTEAGLRVPLAGLVVRVLQCAPARFMGNVSYGVYLVHFPLLLVIGAVINAHHWATNPATRLFTVLLALVPATYAVAWLGHYLVEQPGIRLGHRLLRGKLFQAKLPGPTELIQP